MTVDLTELRGYISDMYADLANLPRGDFHFGTGRPLLEGLGYDTEKLEQIPTGAIESTASVGYHFDLEPLREGEKVLDVGCGAGCDCFYASLHVGESGSVVGVDMTEAMHAKALKNRERFDRSNVDFVLGLAESLPFDDASFDVVVSNGVINLTPEKEVVFDELARILRPGGRTMFSDLVTGVELPRSVRENCALWAECIGGAQERNRYLRMLSSAGFAVEEVVDNDYAFRHESTTKVARQFQLQSISVLAHRA